MKDGTLQTFTVCAALKTGSRASGSRRRRCKKPNSVSRGVIKTSMTNIDNSKLKKEAVKIHKSILGYCGDKTMNFPEMLAQDILKKGVENRKLVDEIYVQICKQLTGNHTPESIARCWQLMCMCVGTFPPSVTFVTIYSTLSSSMSMSLASSVGTHSTPCGGWTAFCLRGPQDSFPRWLRLKRTKRGLQSCDDRARRLIGAHEGPAHHAGPGCRQGGRHLLPLSRSQRSSEGGV